MTAPDEPPGYEQPLPPSVAPSDVGEEPARSVVAGRHHERADTMPHLARARQLGEHRARSTEIALRAVFGWVLLVVLVLQVIAADAVFIAYAVTNNWMIDGTTMQVWLGAAVVQVIGLVWVVVKYLFSADAAPR